MATRPVYSTELLAVLLGDGDTADIDVLPLTTVVVRDVTVAWNSNSTVGYTFVLALVDVAPFIHWDFPPGWRGTRHWHGRKVLTPGDTLEASLTTPSLGASLGVHVSGYVLTDA